MVAALMTRLSSARRRAADAARRRGDEARARGEWHDAAGYYRSFLDVAGDDFAIWVQLGHMCKESGAFNDAERAYMRALRLRANDADLLLNIGHLKKLQGHFQEAAERYVASARLAPSGPALAELHGGWLPLDLRDAALDALSERDAASEKMLSRVTKGMRVVAVRGGRFNPGTGVIEFGYDPRLAFELSRDVRSAPAAVVEIEFERSTGFDCPAGRVFLNTGQGFADGTTFEIPYPAGHSARIAIFVAAPAAVEKLRWDPTELAGGGAIIRSIRARGLTTADELVSRVSGDDVLWSHDYNLIPAEELRGAVQPFFHKGPLGLADHKVMQAFLPTSGDRGKDYAHWRFRYANPGAEEYHRMSVMIGQMAWRPKFSFVMPVYNTDPDLLREVLDAMLGQNYPDLEICIADDCSPKPHVAAILAEYAERDSRVIWMRRKINGHISAASNDAMSLATGDFIVLVDHDDLIPPYALFVVAEYLNRFPDAKILFSDEDKISLKGDLFDPYFKSTYNQFLMFGHNMVSHLGVYARDLLEEIGGFRIGLEGSQDYDLFLRAAERVDPSRIVHIPHVLYHWRQVPGSTSISADQKNYAELAARMSINGHFERTGKPLISVAGHAPGNSAIKPACELTTSVSIIIPTRNGLDLLEPCLDSIAKVCPPGVEVIIADNDSDDPETLAFLADAARRYPEFAVKIVSFPGAFNFSAINNFAAREASGDILCFLNNDTEVLSPGWIGRARGLLAMDDVGAVGGKLLYPDGSVQHFGLVTGMYGHRVAGGVHLFQPGNGYGYLSKPCMVQEFSAVTAACVFVRKEMFDQVGGFEAELEVAYNDVDLCLKLRSAGKRVLCDPQILLIHKESKSRGSDASAERLARLDREAAWMRRRWGKRLVQDPFFSPNHSIDRPDFALAYPPRQKWPWEYDDVSGSSVGPARICRAPRYNFAPNNPDGGFLAICGIMKNEAVNIVEWIAYHHAIGIEKFYLYDNNSTDHVHELLQPLVQMGVVEIISWRINPGQIEAYDDFAARFADGWEWAAFIDMDEFINPYGYDSIPTWLAGFETASAVAIQWRNYGPNGNTTPPPGLLIEGYTTRLEDTNPVHQHVKSIVRMRDYARARSPHSFWVDGAIVDEHGQEINQQAGDYAIMPIRIHSGICLNHYYTRSHAEWHAKVARGMADSAANSVNRRDPAWIEAYEREATTEDRTILRFADRTRAVLSAWGYPEGPSLDRGQLA